VFQIDNVSITLLPPTSAEVLASAPAPALQSIVFLAPWVWPNPASAGEAHLRFASARTGPVRAAIYDVSGRLVRTLADGAVSAPTVHDFALGRSATGSEALAMGIYFYGVQIPEGSFGGRFVIMR